MQLDSQEALLGMRKSRFLTDRNSGQGKGNAQAKRGLAWLWRGLTGLCLVPVAGTLLFTLCMERPGSATEPDARPSAKSLEPKHGPLYRKDGWDVLKGGRKVLWINDLPGTLTSAALLPAGATPARHPFLTGYSRDALEEDRLRGLLDRCRSFSGFVKALRKAGYTVVESDGSSR